MANKSQVYVQTDERGRILRCEGGYTKENIDDLSRWTLIDSGEGDRYNLCQSLYFAPALYDEHGVPVWELDGNAKPRLRKEEDVAADIEALPLPPSKADLEQRVNDLEADTATLAEALMIAFGGV